MSGPTLECALLAKRAVPILLLAGFWCWETWRPFFGRQDDRLRHAARNLVVAVVNTVVMGLLFGTVTTLIAGWTTSRQTGVLHLWDVAGPSRCLLAFVLLDGWLYVWHRANHVVPVLWRFHRMHHSDRRMDVTTATRFHPGEHLISSLFRLLLIPLLGLELWDLVIYDTAVLANTHFHHADISLGRWDRRLRWLLVTPDMHKIHHSDQSNETNSNYATILSVWDRLAGTLRMRTNLRTVVFGLSEFTAPDWQTCWGMWKTPFVKSRVDSSNPTTKT